MCQNAYNYVKLWSKFIKYLNTFYKFKVWSVRRGGPHPTLMVQRLPSFQNTQMVPSTSYSISDGRHICSAYMLTGISTQHISLLSWSWVHCTSHWRCFFPQIALLHTGLTQTQIAQWPKHIQTNSISCTQEVRSQAHSNLCIQCKLINVKILGRGKDGDMSYDTSCKQSHA